MQLKELIKNKHIFKKSLACAVIAASALILATPSQGSDLSPAIQQGTGLQKIADIHKLQEILKKNKQEVLKNGKSRLELDSSCFNFHKSDLHSRAVSVIDTLEKAGFEAYLVGGAVRDLLSGKTPKDYDVVTSARPEQICGLFSNGRVVSKRFKIVLIEFDDEQIEVATFRTTRNRGHNTENHQITADGMLIVDNDFSTSLADDSEHRDLTINGIYFDINKSRLIDFHGGISDLQERLLDVVGDVEGSYRENPVHILRILRFAAKLGFNITPRSEEPIKKIAPLLTQINKTRMFGEVNKLFMSGHSAESYRLLKQYDVLKYLFPHLTPYLQEDSNNKLIEAMLNDMDARHAAHAHEESYAVYADLLWPEFEREYKKTAKKSGSGDKINEDFFNKVADNVLSSQMKVTQFKKSIYQSIVNTWLLQMQFLKIDYCSEMKDVTARTEFIAAFDLLRSRSQFDERLRPYLTIWQPYYDQALSKNSGS